MRLSLLILAGAAFCSSILRAGPILMYSNFDADYGYNSGFGLNIGDGVAVAFTVPDTAPSGFAYALSDILFAASTTNPGDPVAVALYNSDGSVPGAQLESISATLGTDPAVVTVNSVLQPILAGGGVYWVVLSSPNPGEATWNVSNTQSGVAEYTDSWANFSYSQGAVEVDATLVSTGPEPGTFLAFGSGLTALIVLMRRRGAR